MAVRDGESYLDEAMRSVLGQTFTDFECIVVDDGSKDGTDVILDRYQRQDSRICLSRSDGNGLSHALNYGLKLARGTYVARMDADDVSLAGRLAAQVQLMEARPEVGVCGTWIKTFGMGLGEVRRYPTDDATIRSWLLFESVLAHPSVMIRRDLFASAGLVYDTAMLHAEDYDLWVRASQHTQLANVPEVLVRYRLHQQQVVRRHEATKRDTARRIRRCQIERLGIAPTADEESLHEAISGWVFADSREFVTAAHAWLLKLTDANATKGVYPHAPFQHTVADRWWAICSASTHLGLWIFAALRRSPLWGDTKLSWKQQVKFGLNCAIRKSQHG
ncbi:MAG: glycosyltransferase [Nitrospira sp.]|nr:glycosyltransferase [Nitrospira sp.]